MKINVKEANVTSNLAQDNVTAMSISVDGMEHIMELLTNLYKDPELAVIREYYTNALDAHQAAGVTKPVEIKLPTWDDPTYRVKDFGIGMSEDDIRNIYAQYGASTKRNTNDQLGAFGLGCKSALTITQQFTLVSVKDGFKSTVLIAKSESGINTVNVISSIPTTEGNGTSVQIPVKSNLQFFIGKAKRFFAFSKPGSVLVDGVEPDYAPALAQKQDNPNDSSMEVYVRPKNDGESYVIMGPVPYALSQSEIQASLNRIKASNISMGFIRMPKYFVVPVGSVDLTPSREGLRFTDQTNEVIDRHISFLVKDLVELAQRDIDTATSLEDFWEKLKGWRDVIDVEAKFKGEDVPSRVKLDKESRSISRSPWGSASHYVDNYLRLGNINAKQYLVKGYKSDDYKKINGYLTPFLTSLDMDRADFHITDDPDIFSNKWVKFSEHFEIIDGDVIIEKGREQRKKDRLAAAKAKPKDPKKLEYPVLNVSTRKIEWIAYDKIAAGTPYLKVNDFHGKIGEVIREVYRTIGYNDAISENTAQHFRAVTSHNEIILLSNTRTVPALEQRIDGVFSIVPEIHKAALKIDDLITEDMSRWNSISNSAWKTLMANQKIRPRIKEIKDPELTGILNPDAALLQQFDRYNALKASLGFFSAYSSPQPKKSLSHWASSSDEHVERLNRKYPLVVGMRWYNTPDNTEDHVIKYLNLVHSETRK